MAEIGTIARPYAQAAFDVAKNEGKLAEWAEFLNAASSVASAEEVRQLAHNPKVAKNQLESFFVEAVEKSGNALSQSQKNFLAAMVSQSRVDAIASVNEQFLTLKNAHEGSADAIIVSAFEMNAVQIQELVVALEAKLGKKLNPTVSVDAHLIGGFTVTVGDEVLDMSVRAKLARMQSALTA